MNFFRRSILFPTAIASLILSAGCQPKKPPPPLPSPTTLFAVDYYLGTPLSGPTNAVDEHLNSFLRGQFNLFTEQHIKTLEEYSAGLVKLERDASAKRARGEPVDEAALAEVKLLVRDHLAQSSVHVSFFALEKRPATHYPPVGTRAVFFTTGDGGDAVLPSAELTRDASIGEVKYAEDFPAIIRAGNAGRVTLMSSLNGVAERGITANFSAFDPKSVEDPVTGRPTRRYVEVQVSHPSTPAEATQMALVLKDFFKAKDGRQVLRTEHAIFNLPDSDKSNTALIIPFRFDKAFDVQAVAILVQISPGTTEPSHVAATIDCLKKVDAKLAATQPIPGTGEASAQSTVTAAVQSLTPVAGRRSSLAFLADQTNAAICEDMAMEADDAVLAHLVQSIQANVAADESPEPEVGWLLDHTALQLLAKMSDDAANGTARMPAELTAILTTHTGEVGRHSSSLDELLRGVTSRQELDNRLLAENTIFLEDSNPASRVRAFDWLTARHHAPAGYDPLGKGKDRREALERAAGSVQ